MKTTVWSQQMDTPQGKVLQSKALETGRKVAYFAYRNALRRHGIDPMLVDMFREHCPLCGGIA